MKTREWMWLRKARKLRAARSLANGERNKKRVSLVSVNEMRVRGNERASSGENELSRGREHVGQDVAVKRVKMLFGCPRVDR